MFNPTIDRRSALRRLSAVLGGVATVPLASGLLAGCKTPGGAELAAYEYQTLTGTQPILLAAIVDQIIPETDTPGAAEAGVPQFIDMMLTDWYAPEERDQFVAGLDAVDRRANGSFVDLEDAARAELIATMDAEAYAEQPGA
ncbi:gluconate 2-dehydrogenase subunit 3 family protein, partial [Rubrivirga sp.]|uniref:gluconate 2-dehydrogenase subunit 3 family protein n=1 Tax=Rubrivirga sp. TaxID=1885344 RepID=UPI003C70DDC4